MRYVSAEEFLAAAGAAFAFHEDEPIESPAVLSQTSWLSWFKRQAFRGFVAAGFVLA